VKTQTKKFGGAAESPSKSIVITLNSTLFQTITTILDGRVHRAWVVGSTDSLHVIGVMTLSDVLSVFGDFDFLHTAMGTKPHAPRTTPSIS